MYTIVEYQPDGEAPISSTDKRLRKDIANNKATADRYATPRRVTTDEVLKLVNDFVIAAKNAIEAGKYTCDCNIGLSIMMILYKLRNTIYQTCLI